MSVSSRTIAKNTSVLMASQLITWAFTFLLSVLMPRYLGPTGIGQIQLAVSLWMIVGVISALGSDYLVTKEIARSPERMNELVGTVTALRMLIFLFSTLALILYVMVIDYNPVTAMVIWIVGISSVVGQLTGTYDAALKGLERMEFTALASIASIAVLSSLRIGLLVAGYGVILIVAVGILANLVQLAIQSHFLRKRYALKLTIQWRLLIPLLKDSLPFFLFTVGLVLYQQVDTVIISLLVDEQAIGWYGAADRLYGSLLFIPNVFVTALFPALSRANKENTDSAKKLAEKSLNLLLLVSIPIGWGILVIADQLVVLLFGEAFANSGPVLAVIGGTLVLTFVNMLVGLLLISMDRQKVWAYVILLATAATIPLDLVLIPWTVRMYANGALGGALSFVFTEMAMTIAGFSLLPRGYFRWSNWKVVARLVLAGLAMVGAAWFFRDDFLLIPIVVGGVVYVGMVLLLHALPKDDLNFIVGMFQSVLQRVLGRFYWRFYRFFGQSANASGEAAGPVSGVLPTNRKRESMMQLFRQDASRWILPGRISDVGQVTGKKMLVLLIRHMQLRAMLLFRLACWCHQKRIRLAPTVLLRMISLFYGLELPVSQEIGGGLYIAHPYGTVIMPERIGRNCSIVSNVTVGLRNEWSFPVIGDDVFIGAGARVLGGIHIGDGAKIGANAVVIDDVPAGATAVGIPARVVGIPEYQYQEVK